MKGSERSESSRLLAMEPNIWRRKGFLCRMYSCFTRNSRLVVTRLFAVIRREGKGVSETYTDKKLNKIFLIYKEMQNGAVAKSYMYD